MFNNNSNSINTNNNIAKNKFVKKFTTTSTDYDLIEDIGISTILLNFFTQDEIDVGVDISILIYISSVTQVKINNEAFYSDFINDEIYDYTGNISSIIIKDTAISGWLEVVIND